MKIQNTYSTWLDIIFWVPQGSILEPLIFNVFLADFFFFAVNAIDIASNAVDNNPYMIAGNVDDLILFECFEKNLLKSNIQRRI